MGNFELYGNIDNIKGRWYGFVCRTQTQTHEHTNKQTNKQLCNNKAHIAQGAKNAPFFSV
jgi:hypothetical protein